MSTRPFPGPRPDTALQQVQMNPEPMGVSEWAGRVTERKRESERKDIVLCSVGGGGFVCFGAGGSIRIPMIRATGDELRANLYSPTLANFVRFCVIKIIEICPALHDHHPWTHRHHHHHPEGMVVVVDSCGWWWINESLVTDHFVTNFG